MVGPSGSQTVTASEAELPAESAESAHATETVVLLAEIVARGTAEIGAVIPPSCSAATRWKGGTLSLCWGWLAAERMPLPCPAAL
jgi:hypothetical protein